MTTLSSPPDPEARRRREVVEAAAELLATHGPAGFTLRRVAAAVGGSTQVVYSLFGGKPGLADALYAEGFARLARANDAALALAAGPGDPDRILAYGLAYCRFASDSTALFSVMFGRAVPGFTAREQTRRECRESTLGQLVRTAQECLDAGTLEATDATSLAHACWSMAHGVAGLLVADLVPDDESRLLALLRVPVTAHLPTGARDGRT